ncbi:MAG TPA: bifunctional uroporphyrinogen-III C-methyltransferase/uroporphyrinogen-III synthase [Actinocrinis sp.]|uniref:uroporphyrinogen-III synthase n=1 Tax=Actinocrinis sp. TaxID=1920516 RepID=UPI002DDCDD9D|nr:bifunctional uroporphyrinogen-III C-methyltransferase/uroporphyrinogen-III synthase [Actinocrinis sp.]HEV3171850.1 bifunctional uroporphyrinogen-III C-methyltransferase/uroporphyrinogen-III synthase [Actinocrinis sp.]
MSSDAASSQAGAASRARVSFVGAGPGDPDLLTVRAAALLAEADVLVLESGLRDRFVPRCRTAVHVIEVPPTRLCASPDGDVEGVETFASVLRFEAISDAVKAGKFVVRLLDGDPGLFGPLEAEAAQCAKAGVPFEVVPGLARATAVPAFAGIPLTAGPIGDVRLLAAPRVDSNADFNAWSNWHRQLGEAGAASSTLVLIGIGDRVEEVAAELLAAGRPGTTPVAITVDGSLTSQRTVTGPLDRIAAVLKAERVSNPAADTVVVVGSVVDRRAELSWYETKPLFGWRVLVPRTKEQAGALSEQLRSYGAVPHEVPTIAVEPPRTPQQMERAVKGLVTGRYEWVAFTSANAVKAVREKFEDYGLDARAFAGIKVAAVGEQTATALRAFGVVPDLVPSGEQSAVGLLDDFPAYDPAFDPIERVFLPRADIATETLVAGLVELGWEVDDVTAYRTVRAAPPPAEVREAIKGGGFDAVLFTSSSTVRNLVGIAGKPHATTVIACIGPATAKTAQEHGLRVDVLAPTPSAAVLAEALAEFGRDRREAALAAGEPVTRPSERRSSRARRAK